jgi:hypothetical protein
MVSQQADRLRPGELIFVNFLVILVSIPMILLVWPF